MKGASYKRTDIIRFYLQEVPKIGKFIEIESRTVVIKDCGEGMGNRLRGRVSVLRDEESSGKDSGDDCTTM